LIQKYRREVSLIGLVFVLHPQDRYQLLNERRNMVGCNVNERVTDISSMLSEL